MQGLLVGFMHTQGARLSICKDNRCPEQRTPVLEHCCDAAQSALGATW